MHIMSRSSRLPFVRLAPCLIVVICLLLRTSVAQTLDPATTRPAEGIREPSANLYALQNARVMVAPGEVLGRATVIIQRDSIRIVGADVPIPPGAEVIPMEGKTIYAGLVDMGGESDPAASATANPHWHRLVAPGQSPAVPSAATGGSSAGSDSTFPAAASLREQGITAQLIAPNSGIFSGESHAVLTGGPIWMSPILKDSVAQHLQLTVPRRGGGADFPKSPMGAVALVRQTLIDADWYRQATLANQSDRKTTAPVYDPTLQKIADAIESQFFIVDCPNERFVGRADKIAREYSINVILKGSGREYQLLDSVVAADRTLLLPVAFPKAPDVSTAQSADELTLTELMHWHLAPENPAKLASAGVRFAITTAGLEKVSDFLSAVRKSVKRGLSHDQALASLTTIPAELIGLEKRLGTVTAGKLANLIVVDGDLFDDQAKVVETWVAGRRYRHATETTPSDRLESLAGKWVVKLSPPKGGLTEIELAVDYKSGEKEKAARVEASFSIEAPPKPDESEPAKEVKPPVEDAKSDNEKPARQIAKLEDLVAQRDRLTAAIDAAKLSANLPVGFAPVTILITPQDALKDKASIRLDGEIVWPDGEISKLTITSAKSPANDGPIEEDSQATGKTSVANNKDPDNKDPGNKAADESPLDFPITRPLGAGGVTAIPAQPADVIFVGATVWTCGPQGILETTDIRVQAGKIVEIGSGLAKQYAGKKDSVTQVIDASGMHITPGLIDCHSHIATDGGVNEASRAVTADVRISDFIDHTDIAIYRQLAGGLTTSNILHGSANPIGGQNQVIKLRWGSDPERLKFESAPPGVKFALGENVKRDTWRDGAGSRYPLSRMGVEQLLRDRFIAAREYDQKWRDWRSGDRAALPPRRDLRLEALAEVLRGERWIHCHSYRQDEIAALLGVLQEFNVRVGTLQHILEGYKVAELLAESQAMASTFADWWAYKVEVYDAIPYNASLLKGRGIIVSMNSDDAELGRHLNTEAAKAIKYGESSDEDALKMVTLNPAKQLRIEDRVGSIEVGKDADLVLWSGRPMSTTSRCEQTWIDGRPYFTRQADALRRQTESQLRAKLIQAVFAAKKKPTDAAANPANQSDKDESPADQNAPTAQRLIAEEDRWDRIDIYCSARGGRLTQAASGNQSSESEAGKTAGDAQR
ncbi:MAG TPA: N-acetylglucosamine-6-phosphate deacetylase [Planctomycetaceae bacterium]|nr:N-acetylglucosamine-6-phosphate deacetylase [Planctomycetaceae bacterium]